MPALRCFTWWRGSSSTLHGARSILIVTSKLFVMPVSLSFVSLAPFFLALSLPLSLTLSHPGRV